MPEPFAVKDCALISIGTGERAQNLRELRDRLQTIDPGSIFHHFWGCLMHTSFDEPEFQNDFAGWAWHGLRDRPLAERLALVDPSGFPETEDLRRELIEIIEERLEETELVPWAKANQQFSFIRSQIVVFDTSLRIENPRMLSESLHRMSVGSIFYHFIDARRRPTYGRDDFSAWLAGFGDGYTRLVEALSSVDPYFATLTELRRELETLMSGLCDKGHCDAELA